MAEINGLLDGIEDPIAMLNEYSREMEQEITKGQNALDRQLFVEKKQARLLGVGFHFKFFEKYPLKSPLPIQRKRTFFMSYCNQSLYNPSVIAKLYM